MRIPKYVYVCKYVFCSKNTNSRPYCYVHLLWTSRPATWMEAKCSAVCWLSDLITSISLPGISFPCVWRALAYLMRIWWSQFEMEAEDSHTGPWIRTVRVCWICTACMLKATNSLFACGRLRFFLDEIPGRKKSVRLFCYILKIQVIF
jgi:hypothetical protein